MERILNNLQFNDINDNKFYKNNVFFLIFINKRVSRKFYKNNIFFIFYLQKE